MSLLDFFFYPGSVQRKNKYKEEYRAMSEVEKDNHANLMELYAECGGPFSDKEMVEMCEAAQEVDTEEPS